MSQWLTKAAMLGKAPWRAEFLRASGLSSELHSFDEWLFRNASALNSAVATEEGGPSSYGFLMQLPQADRPLDGVAGVFGPSHDQAGRAYPLAVAASMAFAADIGSHPEVIPIVLESYWHGAIDVLTAARFGSPAADDRSLESLTEEPIDSSASARDLYVDWTRRTKVVELCELLERPVAWLGQAVQTIGAAIAARDHVERSAKVRAIRAPLGRAGGGALCFWLDALGRAARWRTRIPSVFWSFDGEFGDALLFLDDPDDTTLSTLWRSGTAARNLCDLTSPEPQAGENLSDYGSAYTAIDRDADRTVSTFLDDFAPR